MSTRTTAVRRAGASLCAALLGVATMSLAPTAAQAACLFLGHPDVGDTPALLNNPGTSVNCDGAFRMIGFLEDHAADNRTAHLKTVGTRADGTVAWTRTATASGIGAVTNIDWVNARVARVQVLVWAENSLGQSTTFRTSYPGQ